MTFLLKKRFVSWTFSVRTRGVLMERRNELIDLLCPFENFAGHLLSRAHALPTFALHVFGVNRK